MKKQNLLILFLFLTMPTLAQEQQPRKNDFGFSTRFFNSPATPFIIMYKRTIAKGVALRGGLNLTYTSTRNNLIDNTGYTDVTTYTIAPSVGAEWQKQIANRLILYYGADIRLSLGTTRTEDHTGNVFLTVTTNDSNITTFAPLFGVRFALMDRLYVATETNFNFNWTSTTSQRNTLATGVINTSSTRVFNMLLQPGIGLYLFYQF
jgi:hypothetical protein